MVKKMMMSFFICLLIPICIIVYFVLFKDLQEKGIIFFQKEDISVLESETHSSEKNEEPLDLEQEVSVDEEENLAEPITEVVHEPFDSIDDDKTKDRKIDQISHKSTEEGLLVQFVTKDENGKIIDEWHETLKNDQIIEQNSDRHLEILAEEFARMHFENERHEVFYSGEMISRDEQYAKVAVIKTEWKANFYKEKYNVILDVSGAEAKPTSMQRVKM